MKNKIYSYFFTEFLSFFLMILFGLTVIVWTVQAVNFLDLVTEDGHSFKVYFAYSVLSIPKNITKLLPFTFFVSLFLTILKLEKDNELIVLWTSGVNKINIVKIIFLISILITFFQLILASTISPLSLNFSRSMLRTSDLSLFSSLLKEKKFNDTVRSLTIFVNKKNLDGTIEQIFLRDDSDPKESQTTIAKTGYLNKSEEKNVLILFNGVIQKQKLNGQINFINFDRTEINLSDYSTKTTTFQKVQELSSINLMQCIFFKMRNKKDLFWNYFVVQNKNKSIKDIKKIENDCTPYKDVDIYNEINRRFGMPLYIPLLSLISCFLLSSRRDSKNKNYNRYLFFMVGFAALVFSEIFVRYSGRVIFVMILYYVMPFILSFINYLFLIKIFKYENLRT